MSVTIRIYTRPALSHSAAEEVALEVTVIKKEKSVIAIIEITIEIEVATTTPEKTANVDVADPESRDTRIIIPIRRITNPLQATSLIVRSTPTNHAIAT